MPSRLAQLGLLLAFAMPAAGLFAADAGAVPGEPQRTATNLSCPEAPAEAGRFACTATVANVSGASNQTPEGTASFSASSGGGSFTFRSCSLTPVPGADGRASCSSEYLAFPGLPGVTLGDRTLSARFAPRDNAIFAASEGNVVATVRAETFPRVNCDRPEVPVGESTTCTVTINHVANPGEGLPSGKVTFSDSSGKGVFNSGPHDNTCTLQPLDGANSTCTVTYKSATAGGVTIKADYPGDAFNKPHSTSVGIKVIAANAVRFAAPGGKGADPCNDSANPCSLFTAADERAPGTSITPGAEVALAPGAYSGAELGPVPGELKLERGIFFHGEAGRAKPRIAGKLLGAGGTVRHIEVSGELSITGGIVEESVVRSSAPKATTCNVSEGVLRDTACISSGDEASAVTIFAFTESGASRTFEQMLRNVTAVSTGVHSVGIAAEIQVRGSGPATLNVSARSVIADGRVSDVNAIAHDFKIPGIPLGNVHVDMDHSDYSAFGTLPPSGPNATITNPLSEPQRGNIVAAPKLANDHIHETLQSPTIDAGATDDASGSVDVDSEPRAVGTADIGADESVPVRDETHLALACAAQVTISHGASCTVALTDLRDPTRHPNGIVVLSSSDPDGSFTPSACAPDASGHCPVPITYLAGSVGGAPRTDTLEAAYGGDLGFDASAAETAIAVAPAAQSEDQTATSLACDPQATIGQDASCTLTVADVTNPTRTPTGTATFSSTDPSSSFHPTFCALNATGHCSTQITYRAAAAAGAPRTDDLRATYGGGAGLKGSSGATAIAVVAGGGGAKHATTTALRCGPTTVILSGIAACTATVEDTAPGASGPSGEVVLQTPAPGKFSDRACTLFALSASRSRCQLFYTPAEVGGDPTHTITAHYEGDDVHEQSQDTAALTVAAKKGTHATAANLSCEPGTVFLGGAVICTATITDTGVGPSPPTGGVVIAGDGAGSFSSEDGCALFAITPNRSACQVIYRPLQVGVSIHQITAIYPGDGAHEPSHADNKATVSVPNGGHRTRTTIACSPSSPELGAQSACTATVANTNASTSAPTGNVVFATDRPGAFATAGCQLTAQGPGRASCQAAYTPIATGEPEIVAAYGGNSANGATEAHEPSLGTTQIHAAPPTVHPTQTTLVCAPSSLAAGASVRCTATVLDSSASPIPPGGQVKVQSDGRGVFSSAGVCTLAGAAAGKSSCPIAYTPASIGSGMHTLTAAYSGDPRHQQSRGIAKLSAPASAPETTIAKKPRRKTAVPQAKFRFSSDQPGSTFQCKLDRKPFRPCRSPFEAKKLKVGTHTFRVRAVNSQGMADPTPALFRWMVGVPRAAGKQPKR
jgi:hypothetical protein